MKKITSVLILMFSLALVSCTVAQRETSKVPPSHEKWNDLLIKHVKKGGLVDYKGFLKDIHNLEAYLKLLSDNAPDENEWSESERLAYWINAYNAFTIKLIIDNYPLKSITKLHPTLSIPGINTVWHRKFFKIGGEDASLDEIEHSILRKKFDEPRIHFAINCASFSCPPLRGEAFTADKVDQQLDEQAISFINDSKRNKLATDQVEISKIFSWFKRDFTKNGSLVEFLNKYSKVKISNDADIDHLKYDWALNDI